jgi:TRAP-type C4-dicarboxylate transport system permease small subunit
MLWQIGIYGSEGLDPTALRPADIYELILRVLRIALALIGAVAFIYIIMGGIQYITAAGNEAKQVEAKKTIQAAVVGFIIVVGGFTLTNMVLRQLQFNDTIRNESPELRELEQKKNSN